MILWVLTLQRQQRIYWRDRTKMTSIDQVSDKEINRVNDFLIRDILNKFNNDVKSIDNDTLRVCRIIEDIISLRMAEINIIMGL